MAWTFGMARMTRLTRWLLGLAILTMADGAVVATTDFSFVGPAQAQRSDDRFPFLSRQRQQRGGGFFQQLFGPSYQQRDEREQQAPADYSRAPAARKADPKAEPVAPTTSIVVLGDGMADWLAYGLEDAFSDAPEIAIVRKSKANSGLLRYDARNDIDWWHAARDILGQEKPNYVVMMLGVSDRQNIRERDIDKEADKKEADKKAADAGQPKKEDDDAAPPAIAAPEPPPAKRVNGVVEFRSEQWEKVYSRRIDETVAALKSKGVPVFWVGLPPIRGTKSTADTVYLNDLYRARAERAGAVYIDVWDGFVDEGGKFTTFGPDYEGQMRRLRTGDGVYFTKYGARKLAHYVEREVRRYMSNRGPIALPSGPMGPVPADGKLVARPLAGPVVPLTVTTGLSEELVGGAGTAQARADAIATGVLVKGDAVAAPVGRADDFFWPRGGDRPPAAPVAATPPKASAAVSPAAPVVAKPEPAQPPSAIANPEPVAKPKPAKPAEAKPADVKPSATTPRPRQEAAPRPRQEVAPRPPQPVRPRNDGPFGPNGPFGWIR